jgi:hypothetical protein
VSPGVLQPKGELSLQTCCRCSEDPLRMQLLIVAGQERCCSKTEQPPLCGWPGLRPWSMLEVCVFGVFVAYVKLGDFAV